MGFSGGMERKLKKYSRPKVKTEGAMVLENIMKVFSKDFIGFKRKYPFGAVKRATNISYRRFKRRILSRLRTEFPVASSPMTTRWQHSYITEYDTVCQRLTLDSPSRSSLSEVPLEDPEVLPPSDKESPLDLGKRGLDVSAKSLLETSCECSRGHSDALKVNGQAEFRMEKLVCLNDTFSIKISCHLQTEVDSSRPESEKQDQDFASTNQFSIKSQSQSTHLDSIWKESGGDENPCSTPLPFSIIETVPSMPCNILKAELQMAVPGLQDDYYLNLLAWSKQNMVALGLSSSVCIWNANTQSLQGSIQLMPYTSDLFGPSSCPLVSSVAWSKDGQTLAIGKSDGEILLWDVERRTSLRKLTGHLSLVGSLSCNQYILSSGSLLGFIHHHDARVARPVVGWLRQKKGICGLAWCPDGGKLASGTTDGLLSIWPDDPGATGKCLPMLNISLPTAVKALAWCPWQLERVAVGGGRQDGALRIWDTHTGACLQSVQTNSQICSLCWCPANQELLTGHGLPHHQITCWKMPSMSRQAELYGHRGRVLHLALSPCGTRIFTVGSDLQACMWKHSDQLIWPQEEADGHYRDNGQCYEML